MTESNIELMRRAAEAFNGLDVETFLAYCDPEIEFESAFAGVGATFRGHEGLRMWLREFAEVWGGGFRQDAEAYFDLGERTLAFTVLRGRGDRSEADVSMAIAAVFEWRDGLIVHWRGYPERADALRDLGVSADELQPIAP
jgi:ketosteroid isomerase-like protein